MPLMETKIGDVFEMKLSWIPDGQTQKTEKVGKLVDIDHELVVGYFEENGKVTEIVNGVFDRDEGISIVMLVPELLSRTPVIYTQAVGINEDKSDLTYYGFFAQDVNGKPTGLGNAKLTFKQISGLSEQEKVKIYSQYHAQAYLMSIKDAIVKDFLDDYPYKLFSILKSLSTHSFKSKHENNQYLVKLFGEDPGQMGK